MNKHYLSLILISCLGLVACGGGDNSYKVDNGAGNGNPPPDPVEPETPVEGDTLLQKVYTDSNQLTVVQGADFDLPLVYLTEPEKTQLAGIGFRVHWSSQYLNFKDTSELYTSSLLGVGDVEVDSDDLDQDPTTDRYIVLSWANFPEGKWPTVAELPLNLTNAKFNAVLQGDTRVNFTASALASGYQFSANAVAVKVQ
ncbi:hypothetical protein [Catenovulum agarivorans]|uniref:hypothetical protein n=1 Tax=Catenovulum agarivorans TaxID=1172192 RepID=UPI0002D5055E|nr:hypothetical protein [Catenovulum agarivorans]